MHPAPRASLLAFLPVLLFLSSFLTPVLAQVRDIVVEPTRIAYEGKALYEKSWAVLIGINRYKSERIKPLQAALNDVRLMRETLLRLGFSPERILTLTEGQATRQAIEELLGDRLRRQVGREDRLFLYFATHGQDEEVKPREFEGYLIPYDANPDALFSTSITMTRLKEMVGRLPAKHVLVAVDACYSGYAIFSGRTGIVNPELVEELTRRPAIQVLTAGRKGELAQEKEGHGLFTRALASALQGAADVRGWGWVSLEDVGTYVRDRVYADSNRGQYPRFGNLAGDGQFVFVLPSESRLPSKPVTPGPAIAPPPKDLTADLLAKADGLMARQALTTPPGANAYEVLQEILRLNPSHPGALERLRKIAETYKGWARQDIERGQKERARRYMDAAKRIFPEDREVAELEDRLAKVEEEARREAERRRAEEERRAREERERAERERLARLDLERKEREERERRERERVAVAPPAMPHERSFPPDNRPMVLVPAGEFIMGSTEEDADAAFRACPGCQREWFLGEIPQRRVYLDGYYIDKYPITNEGFEQFVRATGYRTEAETGDGGFVWTGSKWEKRSGATWRSPGGPGTSIEGRVPVVQISWNDARAYCEWAGKRLPTEAEWEKAARGPDGRKYPWGNEWDASKAIFGGNSGGKPHPVDRTYNTHVSPYSAVDMSGNVWQWVADWYGEKYYTQAENRNPRGPASGQFRVARGGSWWNVYPVGLRSSYRFWFNPVNRNVNLGGRCARTP